MSKNRMQNEVAVSVIVLSSDLKVSFARSTAAKHLQEI